jgi:hypothetical protein
MKSVVLTPYCPWPADTGAKAEMLKHLSILKELGECTIASAATRPVGGGWDGVTIKTAGCYGYSVTLREKQRPAMTFRQLLGLAYACCCKGLRFEKAFGHSNPYHRYAFPATWWQEVVQGGHLAVINYSYWAHLPTTIPKVIILHDLLSEIMWGGCRQEIDDLRHADLVVVISKNEEERLRARGINKVLWSPPSSSLARRQ